MKRRLGSAWLERTADGTFARRRGRRRPGFLGEPAAIVAKDRIIREVERELAERADAETREANAPPTFRVIAHAYLDWREHVRGATPKRCSSTATSSSSPVSRTAAAAASTAG